LITIGIYITYGYPFFKYYDKMQPLLRFNNKTAKVGRVSKQIIGQSLCSISTNVLDSLSIGYVLVNLACSY